MVLLQLAGGEKGLKAKRLSDGDARLPVEKPRQIPAAWRSAVEFKRRS